MPVTLAAGAWQPVRLLYPAMKSPAAFDIRFEHPDGPQRLVIDARELLARLEAQKPPLLTRRVEAVLPRFAHERGHVTARLTLNGLGRVEVIEILESQPPGAYDAAARSAFSRWRYVEGEGSRVAIGRIDFDPKGGP